MKKVIISIIAVMMIGITMVSCSKGDNVKASKETTKAGETTTAVGAELSEITSTTKKNEKADNAAPTNANNKTTAKANSNKATTKPSSKKYERNTNTTTTKRTNVPLAVTEDEAINAIKTMYKGYNVEKVNRKDNVLIFSVRKNKDMYARVKVDLVTGDGVETLAGKNESTSFNILV